MPQPAPAASPASESAAYYFILGRHLEDERKVGQWRLERESGHAAAVGDNDIGPDGADEPVLSHEHKEIGLFTEQEVDALNMPDGYKRSIASWFARLHEDGSG